MICYWNVNFVEFIELLHIWLTGSPGNLISGVQIFPLSISELKLSSNRSCPLQTNPGTLTCETDSSQGYWKAGLLGGADSEGGEGSVGLADWGFSVVPGLGLVVAPEFGFAGLPASST